jgi:hypothetical protein
MSAKGCGRGRPKPRLHYLLYVLAGLALITVTVLRAGRSSPAGLFMPFSLLGIAVLTNVEAGKNRFGRYRKFHIPEIVGGKGTVVETGSLEEIDGALEHILSLEERLICLNGGDGTVQRVLNRMINLYGEETEDFPIFFPMRGGTMNLLADNVGIKGKPDELCRLAMEMDRCRDELPYMEVPTLRLVREMGGKTEREYGFFHGSGGLYRFHRVYYRDTKGGNLPAAKLVLMCLGSGIINRGRYKDVFGMTPLRVTIDDFEMPCDSYIIVLAMIFKKLLLTFNPLRDEGEGDFFFMACGLPLGKLVTSLHKLFWIRDDEPPFPKEVYYNQRASKLVLEGSEGYSFDGEVYELDEPYRLTIELGPKVKVLKI